MASGNEVTFSLSRGAFWGFWVALLVMCLSLVFGFGAAVALDYLGVY